MPSHPYYAKLGVAGLFHVPPRDENSGRILRYHNPVPWLFDRGTGPFERHGSSRKGGSFDEELAFERLVRFVEQCVRDNEKKKRR